MLRRSAPLRSRPVMVAPSHLAPASTASRIRTSENVVRRRSAWTSATNDQSPPLTRSRSKVHRSNRLPSSLHEVKDASKNPHDVNVQLTNALSRCADALNRTSRNVQVSKTTLSVSTSVMSTSRNETPVQVSPVNVSPPQSSCSTAVVTPASTSVRLGPARADTDLRDEPNPAPGRPPRRRRLQRLDEQPARLRRVLLGHVQQQLVVQAQHDLAVQR